MGRVATRSVWGMLVLLAVQSLAAGNQTVFNVRDFSAIGDGKTLDSPAINKAIDACSKSVGGQVFVPPGRYLCGTIHLKSNITLFLDAGAEIVGTPDLEQYQNFTPPRTSTQAARWHRALILGDGVQNVTLTGMGVIDGNKVFDPNGEEHMRGPHAIIFGNAHHVSIRDVSVKDAANYAIFLEFTSQADIQNVKVTGGWDGIHIRGWKDNPCRGISITDCRLYTGDDAIAGWYWQNVVISHCILNSSCNGLRLIGPAEHLIVHDCLFFGPGRYEHRTSKRPNMLAGLCLQPGAWEHTEGPLDDVRISDVTMHNVTTPLHLALKPGNAAGEISIDRLTATGVYRAAASIESWAQSPIAHVSLRDVTLQFTGGGTEQQARMDVRAPATDARPLPAWGIYARNVGRLDLQNVWLGLDHPDARPVLIAHTVQTLSLNGFHVPPESKPMVLKDVERSIGGPLTE